MYVFISIFGDIPVKFPVVYKFPEGRTEFFELLYPQHWAEPKY
jgi:hypothetical protein